MTQREKADELEGFEVFHRERYFRGLAISFTSRGTMTLSRGAYETLGRPSHVVLGYSRARRMIAIHAAGDTEPDGFKVTEGQGSAQIASSRLLKYLGLKERVTGRFPAEMTGDSWLAVVIEDWPEKDAP